MRPLAEKLVEDGLGPRTADRILKCSRTSPEVAEAVHRWRRGIDLTHCLAWAVVKLAEWLERTERELVKSKSTTDVNTLVAVAQIATKGVATPEDLSQLGPGRDGFYLVEDD